MERTELHIGKWNGRFHVGCVRLVGFAVVKYPDGCPLSLSSLTTLPYVRPLPCLNRSKHWSMPMLIVAVG